MGCLVGLFYLCVVVVVRLVWFIRRLFVWVCIVDLFDWCAVGWL